MIESSLTSLGAKVVLVASSDENHPPENIIDGNTKTFWMSTGMFPQEFIIRFPEPTSIGTVTVDSYNVKHLKIEKNTSQNASQFEFVAEKEFEYTEGHLQSNAITLNGSSATHLRFIITSGYDHFVSVHRMPQGVELHIDSLTLHNSMNVGCSADLLRHLRSWTLQILLQKTAVLVLCLLSPLWILNMRAVVK